MKFITSSIALLTLTGCLATADLLKDRNGLPDDLQIVGVKMVNLAQQSCIVISGPEGTPKDDWVKGRKLDSDWAVRRFYTSNTKWFKAEAVSRGVWGTLYFNDSTKQFICGDLAWNKFSNSNSINFFEYGTKQIMLKNEAANKNQINLNSFRGEAKLKDTEILIFRTRGLKKVKYDSDAALCQDIKLGLEYFINKQDINSTSATGLISNQKITDGLRMLKVGELFNDFSKYSKQQEVLQECRDIHFNN